MPAKDRFLICTICEGSEKDSITCDPFDIDTYGPLVAMQNHLRNEHLGAEYQGTENDDRFRTLLQGHGEHVFAGAYLYFLADDRPYQFAGIPGQFQEWVRWTKAGKPPLSGACLQGQHRRCFGGREGGGHCGCPHCNHPDNSQLVPPTITPPPVVEPLSPTTTPSAATDGQDDDGQDDFSIFYAA